MTTTSVPVSARVECRVTESADLVFSVAVAGDAAREEFLACTLDGRTLDVEEVAADHGTRLHVVGHVPPGDLVLDYRATAEPMADHPPITAAEAIALRRPSRYCESERLAVPAARLFGGLEGQELIDAVVAWVADNTLYVPGASGPSDGAVDTFLSGEGVCRDYAHVVIALLRARGVPARLVSVYAPGLSPMDFHAVVEAAHDGQWQVLDATRLAPRPSMVRIATGRDAADTAFLTVHSGRVDFGSVLVTAVAEPALPVDDPRAPVHLQRWTVPPHPGRTWSRPL